MRIKTQLENRRYILPDRNHQFLIPRVQVHYIFQNGVDISGGVSHFRTAFPQDNEIDIERCRAEFRPHQELILRQQVGKILLSHRYRLEERFYYLRSEDEDLFRMRFRYRLQGKLPVSKPDSGRDIFVKVFNEIHLNLGQGANPFNQNRFYGGLVIELDEKFDIELGYMNWYQLRSEGDSFFNRHILRATLHHSIHL